MEAAPQILVTGATGMVGSRLLYDLARKGKMVRATRRQGSSMQLVDRYFNAGNTDLTNHLQWVECDVLDVHSLEKAMEGIQQVYHCAALVMFDPRRQRKIMATNARGTANVVNAALNAGVKKFCQFSSVAALGRGEAETEINESTILGKHRNYHYYGLSKHQAEREAWRGMAEGLGLIVLNPAVIIGPGDWMYDSSYIITMVDRGLKFYSPGIISVVDVRDVSDAAIALMESQVNGEQFIMASESMAYKDFLGAIAGQLNIPPPSVRVSRWVIELAWRAAMIYSWVSGKRLPLTREPAEATYSKTKYSGEKLALWRGKKYIGAGEMIRECCKAYLEDSAKI